MSLAADFLMLASFSWLPPSVLWHCWLESMSS